MYSDKVNDAKFSQNAAKYKARYLALKNQMKPQTGGALENRCQICMELYDRGLHKPVGLHGHTRDLAREHFICLSCYYRYPLFLGSRCAHCNKGFLYNYSRLYAFNQDFQLLTDEKDNLEVVDLDTQQIIDQGYVPPILGNVAAIDDMQQHDLYRQLCTTFGIQNIRTPVPVPKYKPIAVATRGQNEPIVPFNQDTHMTHGTATNSNTMDVRGNRSQRRAARFSQMLNEEYYDYDAGSGGGGRSRQSYITALEGSIKDLSLTPSQEKILKKIKENVSEEYYVNVLRDLFYDEILPSTLGAVYATIRYQNTQEYENEGYDDDNDPDHELSNRVFNKAKKKGATDEDHPIFRKKRE